MDRLRRQFHSVPGWAEWPLTPPGTARRQAPPRCPPPAVGKRPAGNRRAKDRDRANGAGWIMRMSGGANRLAIWQGFSSTAGRSQMRAFADVIGKEASCPGCPPTLALVGRLRAGRISRVPISVDDPRRGPPISSQWRSKEIGRVFSAVGKRGVRPKRRLGGFRRLGSQCGRCAAWKLIAFAGGQENWQTSPAADPFTCDQIACRGGENVCVRAQDQSFVGFLFRGWGRAGAMVPGPAHPSAA